VADHDPPIADSGTVARVRNALAGGKRALGRERDLAAYAERRFPGAGDLVRAEQAFHRRAARWAAAEEKLAVPAAGIIFGNAGLPVPDGPPLHALAAEVSPSARFAYADGDPKVTEINRSALAEPGKVTVMTARAWNPAELLGTPQARELLALEGISVHIVGGPHFWPADLTENAIAGYGRLLPPGSSLCISWGVPDPTPDGEELLGIIGMAGGRAWSHSPQKMARWLEGAGLGLHPQGITDARAFAAPFAKPSGPRAPMTVMEAVAVKP
jgi:S-adenosyl methyltransferase